LFRRWQPDIVHTHTAKAGAVGRVAGFLYRWLTLETLIGKPRPCKFVHTYHGHVFHSYYGRGRTRLWLAIERLLARVVSDRLIVISNQQSVEIGESFRVGRPDQIRVIPLGLDLDVFADYASRRAKFRQELCVADDAILVGIVGRLTAIKDHEIFLRAIARLRLRRVDLRSPFMAPTIRSSSPRGRPSSASIPSAMRPSGLTRSGCTRSSAPS